MKWNRLLQVFSLVLLFSLTAHAQVGVQCVGGVSIIAPGGVTSLTLCQGDGVPNQVKFRTSKLSTPFGYVVVDENNIIVRITTNNLINFELLPPGNLRVYAFSFIGQITAQVGQSLDAGPLASVCSELTINYIEIFNTVPDGGTVSTAAGNSSQYACPSDGNPDVVEFSTTATSSSYVYVITDENNIILEVVNGTSFDFENSAQGICRVWGLNYVGTLLAAPGLDADSDMLASQCYDLSNNYVEIVKTTPDGGTVSLTNGDTNISVCTGGAAPGQLNFANQTTSGAPYVFILTNENNVIIDVLSSNSLNFGTLPNGTSRVWGVSYIGNFTGNPGDNAATGALSDGCYDLSDNYVEIIKQDIGGGMLSTAGGTDLLLCANDNDPDQVTVSVSVTPSANYLYVLTDADNVVLAISTDPTIDFSGQGTGAYHIWGLAYTGNLLLEVGDDLDTGSLSDECYNLSGNFISVSLKNADGGTIALDGGDTSASVCTGDGQADVLNFTAAGTDGDNYVYLLTDENNVILEILTDPSYDFEADLDGTVRIWGLAYTGSLTATAGDDAAATTLSDGCYDLSDDFIAITRMYVDGGTVALEGGNTETFVCGDDGEADILTFENQTTSGASYAFVLTDANNIIIEVLSGNSFDFDAVPAGICKVWGLSYTGAITAQPGDDAANTALTDGCQELSSNFVKIRKEAVDGGTVAMPDGTTERYSCPGDGNPDVVQFETTGASTSSYTYLITDENNKVLEITDAAMFDFDGMPAGTCRVWGLAYSGNLTLQVGDIATDGANALSDECYDLSDNFIAIIKVNPDGGTLASIDGATTVYSCPDDSTSQIVTITPTGASNSPYVYVVTDASGTIISISTEADIDVAAFGEGEYHLYGLAYTGEITGAVGDIIADVLLSDDCFDLSDNFITVLRQPVNGGTVALTDGETTLATCPGDTLPNLVSYLSNDATGANFTFVFTNSENMIIGFGTETTIDLSTLPSPNVRIWGLSFSGNLLAATGDVITDVTLSDGCFDLSDNFIEIVREAPQGGIISTPDGVTSLDLCVGDGASDLVQFSIQGGSSNDYAYLITDEDDYLIGILTQDSFDFENAIGGNWKVYGVAYIGQLLPFPGDNIFEVPIASQCWDLTDNFLAINMSQVDGGILFADGSNDTQYICAGDGQPDVLTFLNSSLATDASYRYVITTESNVILAFINGNEQDFENTGFTRLRVWGVSFTGQFQAGLGNIITQATLSDGCYTLSENYISIVRGQPSGGEVSGNDTDEIKLCIGADSGILHMESTSNSPVGYVYLITSVNNVIFTVTDDPDIDFNAFNPGIYRVWGLSYTGTLNIIPGQVATVVQLASSCFQLSSNFVTVIRSFPVDGGTLSTTVGETTFYTCPGDNVSDVIVLLTTSLDTNYRYIITDTFNRVLIPNINGNVLDFDAATPNEIRIYGLSFLGNYNVGFGDDIYADPLSDDCFEVSENYITVIIGVPVAGSVFTAGGETSVTVVTGDGEADVVEFTHPGASNSPYAYVITDENNKVIEVVTSDAFDFEGISEGLYRVWGLAYTGHITVNPGDDLATAVLSDDCFDLTDNFVEVSAQTTPFTGDDQQGLQQSNQAATAARSELKAMPNPVTDLLSVQWTNEAKTGQGQVQVQVVNTAGQVLRTLQMTTEGVRNRFELNVSDLLPGVYMLQVRQDSEIKTIRFVKS